MNYNFIHKTYTFYLWGIYLMKNMVLAFTFFFLCLSAQSNEEVKNQLQNLGISPDQAKNIAKQQGYDNLQNKSDNISDNKINAIQDKTLNQNNIDDNNQPDIDITNNENISDNVSITKPLDGSLDYFGYNIFVADPKSFQTSTFGAVDPYYNIGPGDEIIVMLWGEAQFRQVYTIDREGYVFVPDVGQIFVNGLNLESLEKKFYQILSKVYSTLKPSQGQPTTFMDISLGNLRPLRIIVLGEVAQPGAYSVSPSASLSSALYYFNGPTISGSLRDIHLIRSGKLTGSIDFYDYLLSGRMPNDLRLQLDDIVFLKPRGKTISVSGEINRQGIYELKESEGLKDLIKFAGNLKSSAYMNRAQISRIIPFNDRESLGMDRMLLDVNLKDIMKDKNEIELFDGDDLKIFSISDSITNYIDILGSSVSMPGRYEYFPRMKVSDLIDAANGLLNSAMLTEGHLFRINNDLTNDIISLDLKEVLNNDPKNNIFLKKMDRLIVYNNKDLKNLNKVVYVSGFIKDPGVYSFEKGQTLGDIIALTGGLSENVNNIRITISRNILNSFRVKVFTFPDKENNYLSVKDLFDNDNDIHNFNLLPNDIINIYKDPRDKLPDIVNISGAVYFPGNYPIISERERISDIIKRAGGLLPNAYPEASSFIRNQKSINLSFSKIIKNQNSSENFIIMDGDNIKISVRSNIVEIIGEVNQPGIYKYYKDYSVRKYLKIAGGLSTKAEKKEIWVTNPDGTSKQLSFFSFPPRVSDGSIITIGLKKDTDPINKTELAKEVTSIIADFLQVYITITLLWNTANNSS